MKARYVSNTSCYILNIFLVSIIFLMYYNFDSFFHRSKNNRKQNPSDSIVDQPDELEQHKTQMIKTWPDDEECLQYETRFTTNISKSLLVSFHVSGESSLRYIVQKASGLFTEPLGGTPSKFRHDIEAYEISPLFVEEDLYLQSLNSKSSSKDPKFVPLVFIIRNIAEVIISLWVQRQQREYRAKNIDLSPLELEKTFDTKVFNYFMEKELSEWKELVISLLRKKRPLMHIVFYESLLRRPMEEVKSVLDYLDLTHDEGRLSCLDKHSGEIRKESENSIDPLLNSQRGRINIVVKVVSKILTIRGFRPPPEFILSPKLKKIDESKMEGKE